MNRSVLALNFLLAGVGGQGTLLAADVLARVGLKMGLGVKKSEIHGMAQRGGSVTSHVRWGETVYAPVITPGEVDYLIAFERLEALRYADQLRPGGALLVNDYRIVPVSASSGTELYPTEEQEAATYTGMGQRRIYVPAMAIAHEVGQVRANNVVLLGALSTLLSVPEEIWIEVISGRVPERFIALNQRAFVAGRAFMEASAEHAQ